MMNIICIDIDDSLLNRSSKLNDKTREELFMNNLMKIQDIMRSIDGEVFLISSWSKLFDYVGGDIYLKREVIDKIKDIKDSEFLISIISILKTFFDGRWYGISSGDRIRDIKKLLEDGNRVVALDDYDLSEIEHKNYKYIRTVNRVTGWMATDMIRFFNRRVDER